MDFDWKYLFFSFRGRINRKPFWIGSLLLVFGGGAAIAVLAFSTGQLLDFGTGQAKNEADLSPEILILPILAIIALMLFCSLALSVKRLHDRNKSAWWLLLFYGVGALQSGAQESGIATVEGELSPVAIALILANIVVSIWYFIEVGILKGTDGDNDYGPDPLTAIPRQKDASF